jgi:hypothetical protein
MRPGNCIDKSKAETVTGRILALYESLETLPADIRRESRTVVLDY